MPDTNLTRIPASRVPITDASKGMVTREWYRFFFNQFTLTGSGEANSEIVNGALSPSYTPQLNDNRYGTFSSLVTQTAAAINTAYPITLNSTELTHGVYIGTPTSRVYVDRPGVYNFQFSLQLNKSSATAKHVFIWCRINGNNVANSATKITLQGSNAAAVPAWNFVLSMAAGDYFELVWSTDDTGCVIQADAAAPPVPAIPSVILTVTDNIV